MPVDIVDPQTGQQDFLIQLRAHYGISHDQGLELGQIELYGLDPQKALDQDTKTFILSHPVTLGLLRKALDRAKKSQSVVLKEQREDTNGAFHYQPLPPTRWQRVKKPLTVLHNALKWMVREILINKLSMPCSWLVTLIANRTNPHYKIPSSDLTHVLGKLIFPAGLSRPVFAAKRDTRGTIRVDLGPILSHQFNALMDATHQQTQRAFGQEPGQHPTEFKVHLDDAVLTGVTHHNHPQQTDPTYQCLHLLYFNGNSGAYQGDIHNVSNDLKLFRSEHDLDVTAVQFNYPGVLDSTGQVKQAHDLVQAGIAQVERLNKQLHIPYHLIALHGVSLGGSIAAHVANYYYDRGILLAGLYASRTFSSTTAVALSYLEKAILLFAKKIQRQLKNNTLGRWIGHTLGPGLAALICALCKPFIALGLWGSRWQLDTAEHFCSLPEDKRQYSVVRSPKSLRTDPEHLPKDDAVLVHSASLHEAWRLKLKRFFEKRTGSQAARQQRKMANRRRKMGVFQITDPITPPAHQPNICGHAQADFNHHYTTPQGYFLLHRRATPTAPSRIPEDEAGYVFRAQIKAWAG
jgi:hypothetical protein